MGLANPDQVYFISADEVLWGGLLTALTMVIHGFGMLLTLRVADSFKPRLDRSESFTLGVSVLILSSWKILMVHLLEVLMWAGFFVWKGGMPNLSTSYYFTLMDYTTVGSYYNLPQNWRLLEGMVAIAGLLTIAWSTGVMLALATDFQKRQLEIITRKRERKLHKKISHPLPQTAREKSREPGQGHG